MKNDKYEFIFEYSSAEFVAELSRFQAIEGKAARFLSFLSIGVLAYTFVLRFLADAFYPANSAFQCLQLIFIVLTFSAMLSAWSLLYRALSFTEMPRLPLDEKLLDWFRQNDLPTIHWGLSKTCAKALLDARSANTRKLELLRMAYEDITITMWLLVISIILISIQKLFL